MRKDEKTYKQIHQEISMFKYSFDVFFDKLKFQDYLVENYLTVKPKVSHGSNKIVGICVLPEFESSFFNERLEASV